MSAKKILLAVVGLLSLGLVGLLILVFAGLPRYVKAEVVREARARGVELVPGSIEFGFGWVRVKDAKLSLIGVAGLSAEVGTIQADLQGLTPKAFALEQVRAHAEGDPAPWIRELMAWVQAHEGELREPVIVAPLSFEHLGVTRGKGESPALFALEGGELRVQDERRQLTVRRTRLLGRELGEARAVLAKERTRVDLTLGESAIENPLLAFEVDQTRPSERRVALALSPVPVARLAALMGVTSPLGKDATVTGTFSARVPEGLAAGAAVEGALDLTLKGYIPPHPIELDGFVFGDTTTFGTRYRLDPRALQVELEGTQVKAGAFALSGGGTVQVNLPDVGLSLLLSGALPCNALASAAANTRLGRALGKVTGKAALQTLSGSVGVRVSVRASSANLNQPRILKTISPGCGLKPLSFPELVALGELVPEALDPKVAEDFQELMRKHFPGLPSVPGVNAPLPLPKLPAPILPAPTLPKLRVAPTATGSALPASAPPPTSAPPPAN